MSSASTKRRKVRDAALLEQWSGTPVGTKVTVHRANSQMLRTVTASEPFGLHAGAYVRVHGIDLNVHLRRVTLGWDASQRPVYADARLPWNDKAETEIQRLRAAMVHSMDDCEQAAQHAQNPPAVRTAMRLVAKRLKAELEKK